MRLGDANAVFREGDMVSVWAKAKVSDSAEALLVEGKAAICSSCRV